MQSVTTAVFKVKNVKNSLDSLQARRKQMRIKSREEFGVEEFQRKYSANSSNSDSENHQHTICGM